MPASFTKKRKPAADPPPLSNIQQSPSVSHNHKRMVSKRDDGGSREAGVVRTSQMARLRSKRVLVAILACAAVVTIACSYVSGVGNAVAIGRLAAMGSSEIRQMDKTTSPRVLYYNRHGACTNNMNYVTRRLGLNYTLIRPGFLGDLGMREGRANDIIGDGFVKVVCAAADVIIISDTLPDARPLLQSLLRKNPSDRCQSHIVIELTNRFDWGIFDFDEYHQLIWELSRANLTNLHWVANNAFEAKVMADDCMANPSFRLLRPSGFSDVPKKDVATEDKSLALIRELDRSEVLATMTYMDIPFKRVVGHYGGPATLQEYRAYIEFPYQVSTMKLYENLAAGVAMLVPSPSFFKELIEKRIHAFGPWEMLRRMGVDWHLYMDYYHPALSPYLYYFDSFEQLKGLLSSSQPLDTRNVRLGAVAAYARMNEEMLHGWAELFAEMGFNGVLVDGKTRRKSGVEVFRVPLVQRGSSPLPSTLEEWRRAYGEVKEWKSKQREEQIRIWDANEARLSVLERKMKEIANTGKTSVLEMKEDAKRGVIDLTQYQMLDYLHGELHKDDGVFGGSLFKNAGDSFDVAQGLEALLKGYETEKEADFKASDFLTFGRMARFLHAFHVLRESDKLDSVVVSKVTQAEKRLMTATEYLLPRLYPWLSYSSIENAMATWKGRGIAFTFPTSGYARGVHLILTLRNILRCTLPIEIFYIGDKDLAFEKRRELSKLSGVTLIDIQERLPLVTEVHGFNIKPFVMLASSFREVIFMDDDVTMLQNPDALLDASALYSKYGTLFFLDRSFSGGNSEWVRSFVPHPSAASLGSRYMTNVSRDEQESSLVVLDKGRVGIVHALLAACHMNLKESRDEALHKHTHGDKESFWIAHELVRTPYAFVPGIGGAAGFFRTKQGIKEPDVVCGPQSHIDEERRLTHFNGLTLKYKDDPSKGYLDFHHYVAPVLENPGNVDIGYHPWCVHSRKPAEEVIEFNEREKGVIGKIIELHKELVKSEFAVPA